MQRDQKVGLALGVLLIGAVAAFFFRNEPDPSVRISQLASADEVNREIAEKRLTPYFPETGDSSGSESETPREIAETRSGERRLPRWEELKSEGSDPFLDDSAVHRIPAPAPDPIPAGKLPADVSAITPAADELEQAAPPPAETIHEVQRGDTLSSIAGKYLGSQARYLEVFEANRDQLRDANDLQVGMKLKILQATSPPVAKKTPPMPTEPVREPKSVSRTDSPANSAPAFVPASASNSSEAQPPDGVKPPVVEQKSESTPDPPKLKFAPAKRRPRAATSPSSG